MLISKTNLNLTLCVWCSPSFQQELGPKVTILRAHQLPAETELGIQRHHRVTLLHLVLGDLSVFKVVSWKEKCNGRCCLLWKSLLRSSMKSNALNRTGLKY